MPKVKTKSAAKKRFALVGDSSKRKIKRAKAFRRHLLNGKTTKRKRNLRKGGYVASVDNTRIAALLPYA
ncbi:MAG TPA: 50S ribosomal protein L35 [Candidatus Babeliales bacterium]|jgi:large subunit ribosomal protein L35|nr:50S ribosomal protein L35 [Candidatus Babeliales bacterium]